VDLPDSAAGGAAAGGDAAGDLPQGHRLALARSFADGQVRSGAGQVVLVFPGPVVSAGDRGELAGGDIQGRPFAPGEQAGPGLGDVGEQGRGPGCCLSAWLVSWVA